MAREFGPGKYDIHYTQIPKKNLPPDTNLARVSYGDIYQLGHATGGSMHVIPNVTFERLREIMQGSGPGSMKEMFQAISQHSLIGFSVEWHPFGKQGAEDWEKYRKTPLSGVIVEIK